eukprot:UN24645
MNEGQAEGEDDMSDGERDQRSSVPGMTVNKNNNSKKNVFVASENEKDRPKKNKNPKNTKDRGFRRRRSGSISAGNSSLDSFSMDSDTNEYYEASVAYQNHKQKQFETAENAQSNIYPYKKGEKCLYWSSSKQTWLHCTFSKKHETKQLFCWVCFGKKEFEVRYGKIQPAKNLNKNKTNNKKSDSDEDEIPKKRQKKKTR